MRCRRKAIGVDGGGVPFRSDLDQSLNAYIINENGSIVDSQSGLSAQLVEQPAGISVGAGTLTFSEDIDSVTSFGKAVAGTATINGGDAKQLDLSADTFWDIQLVVNGVAVRIPDPYTGYDINNNYHGTPANITEGTQDESAVIQSVGFNKYIKNTSTGVNAIQSSQAYGEWLIPIYKDTDLGTLDINIIDSDIDSSGDGYQLSFSNTEQIKLLKTDISIMFATATSYISINTLYLVKIVRNKTTDQYVTGPVGTFGLYIMGGAFGWTSWTLVDVSGGSGTNPVTDNTYTTSAYHVNDIDTGDMYGKIKQTDENGNVRWLSDDINDWHVVSGTFENHLVPADLSAPTYDVLGNPLHYLPKGILPLGAIEFNPDDTAPTPAVLRLFDRDNIIGQTYEYWKTEIDDIASYDASHPERHSLTELTNGDYIRVFGTQLLIQRLFLKAFKTDDDWTAISNILNYSAVLDATERQKVFNYLKDPSKSNQEAWELYQISTVVAAYRFDQPLSLFNEDGELCKLGWEGEELAESDDCSADNTADWTESDCTLTFDTDHYVITETDVTQWIYKIAPLISGTNYKFTASIKEGTFSGDISFKLSDSFNTNLVITEIVSLTADWVSYSFIGKATSGTEFMGFFSGAGAGETWLIKDIKIEPVGDLVAKVLDVGSGRTDGLTYYNLTQSDLSLQPKRVAGGLEFDGVDDKMDLGLVTLTNAFDISINLTPTDFNDNRFIGRDSITSYIRYRSVASIRINFDSTLIDLSTDLSMTVDTPILFRFVRDSNDLITFYIDGVLQSSSETKTGTFTIDKIGSAGTSFCGSIKYVTIKDLS